MNITERDLRAYIEAFHASLNAVAKEFLPPEQRSELLHTSLLPALITGYVSTQFGVAIEYERASETSIRTVLGSARAEDLLVQGPSEMRGTGPMFRIGPTNICIANLTLAGAFPFRLTSDNASVSIQGVAFEFGTWRRVVQFAEVFGDRRASRWRTEKAESLAKDEVLVAMLQLARAREKRIPISEYIELFKDKTVLLLGDYAPEGMRRLEAIASALSSCGYEPLLLRDIPDHPHHDLSQKVVLFGALSRFVVVDDSSKSGHLLEVQLCKENNWVTVLLRAGGLSGSWMTAGASHASNVLKELPYDATSPHEAVQGAVRWAEAALGDQQRKFESTYPWRAPSRD